MKILKNAYKFERSRDAHLHFFNDSITLMWVFFFLMKFEKKFGNYDFGLGGMTDGQKVQN